MLNFLPNSSGYLPLWTLLISLIAIFNTFQNLLTLSLTKQIYNAKPEQVTGLSSRTFAVWSFCSAIIRFYVAYNIHIESIYQLGIWTYVIGFTHFTSELLYFRSANIGPGLLSPIIVS
ncbi:2072_t:CDS:2, partial [Diversispora eburnea]